MYKVTPDQFRRAGRFYPLQMKICLRECSGKTDFSKEDIRFAVWEDMEEWMELVHFSIDGYPCLEEASYKERLRQCIAREEALVLREKEMLIGVMGISREKGSIEFLAVHPQYRRHNIEAVFLEKLAEDLFCGREISTTTFREGDRADTGYRQVWRSLGFVERELLMEYGYPTQRLVLPPVKEETIWKDRKKYVSF